MTVLSRERMLMIHDAAVAYREDSHRSIDHLSDVLEGMTGREYSYLCRCLARHILTHKDLVEKVPKHIGNLCVEFLRDMLEFPWNIIILLSPVQVAIEISKIHQFFDQDHEQLARTIVNYLERFPETAASEFSSVQRISTQFAEQIWSHLSIATRDEIKFTCRRRALYRWLHELMEVADGTSLGEIASSLDIEDMCRRLDRIRRSAHFGKESAQRDKPLITLIALPELDESLPILGPWAESRCPPFVYQSLLRGEYSYNSEAAPSGTRRGEVGQDRSLAGSSDLDELAERLCKEEQLSPRSHRHAFENLSPDQLAYLCVKMLSQRPCRSRIQSFVVDQLPLLVRGLDNNFFVKMLDDAWDGESGDLNRLDLVYEMARSLGLMTPVRRIGFADAFAYYLNVHPERAGEELADAMGNWSIRFATEVWFRSDVAVRTAALAWFCRGLETEIDDLPFILLRMGLKLEKVVDSTIESVGVSPEKQELAALWRETCGDLIRRARLGFSLLGAVGATMLARQGGPCNVTEIRRACEEGPAFIAGYSLSDSFGLPRSSRREGRWISRFFRRASFNDPVYVGVSVPVDVRPRSEFVARLYAYVEECQERVEDIVDALSPKSRNISEARQCRWRVGEKVRVCVSGTHMVCEQPTAEFEWSGSYDIVDFGFCVDSNPPTDCGLITFTVEVAGISVASIKMEICIRDDTSSAMQGANTEAARTGFASYAVEDRIEVLGRVSSIEQSAGMLVFLDCLDLRAGEEWKPRLEQEIIDRDVFLLFWSEYAKRSRWVDWEWRTALNKKNGRMEIHPIQSGEKASPPPTELSHLNFSDRYVMLRDTRNSGTSSPFQR